VNWFRKSDGGDFLWPGFGENSRVLQWVFDRCEGTAKAIETPIGNLPADGALDLDGLDIGADDLAQLLRVDIEGWLQELPLIREYYQEFGERLPKQLVGELDAMRERLEAAKG
jgi:phosphoenolpyruvate carboxykinase (GTP)